MTEYSGAELEAASHALWREFNYSLPTLPYILAKIVLNAAAEARKDEEIYFAV